ncbi:MAG: hypothetical protein SNJ82_07605 [Gemmataceae bacterium]
MGLFAAPERAQSCHRGHCSVGYCYSPAYYPCYPQPYPCYPPGQIVAASATIFVHVPADAKLFADGKPVEGTGPVRVVTTDTIPIGQELVVTLRVEGKGKGSGGDDGDGPPKDPKDPGPKPPPGADGGDKGGDKGEAVTKKVSVRPFQVVHVDLKTK